MQQEENERNRQLSESTRLLTESSREIALATMEDSSAMKTIAIMTMVFLPGTAIAVCYSV
jgi:Mg2+ and Co2+ transporter CorA